MCPIRSLAGLAFLILTCLSCLAEAQRTTPVLLGIPTFGDRDRLTAAWNAGLGRPFDIVGDAPLVDNFEDLAKVKIGAYAWTTPSLEQARKTAAQVPLPLKWLFYDFEHWPQTPQSEQADVVAASRAVRAFCDAHHWKAGIAPVYRDGLPLARSLAPFYDAYVVQCQKFQNDARREQTIKYLRDVTAAVHAVNPKCLVGCQLGVPDMYGDGSPGSGLKAALALYESTKGFIQIYGAWWPPDAEGMIQLLKAMDASPAKR